MDDQHTISQWSTYFHIGKVKEHSEILTQFTPFIEDESNFVEPWMYSKCKSTCQHPNNENLPWNYFFEAIKLNVENFFQSLEPSVNYHISCDEVWLNVYEKNGYQEIHDHAFPNRSFSCAYMLELPEDQPAGLIFENTNFPIIQSTGINRIFDAFNYEKFIPNLTEGMLVIFPSWIKHYVLPNNSDSRRTTISANFKIEGDYV